MTAVDMLLLAVLSLFWGSSFLLIRIGVPDFGPATLVMARVLLGAAVLYIIARAVRRPIVVKPYFRRLVILGLLNAALPYVLISAAELELTASFAAVLNATAPLFAATFGAVWLSERLTTRRVTGLIAGVIGVAILVGWSPSPLTAATLVAIAAMLVASASYAAAGIYAKLKLSGVDVHTLALGQQLGALVWLSAPGIIWAPDDVPAPGAVWAVVGLGVLSTALAYLLYFRLLERIGPTRVSTVTYILPVVGILWGVLLLDEPVSAGMFVGLAVVLGSVVLVNDIKVTPLLARLQDRRRVTAP